MRASRRGIALLLVVGVLGILAVLGAAFVTMAQLERRASLQRLNATKASLLARSGIEDALARLSAGQEPSYGGEDWALDGYDPYDQAQEVFGPGVLDLGTCPARHALRPSWFKRDGTGKPWRTGVEGRDRGHSGELRAGAQYVQKVVPAEGIFVNGGDLSSGGEHAGTYDGTLKRILGNLAEEVGQPRAAGEDLVLNRPAGGWTSLDQVPAAMRPYLVLEAWVDRKVIRPNVHPDWDPQPSPIMDVETAAAWAEIKVGQRDAATNPSGPLYNEYDWLNFGWVSFTSNTGKPWSGKRAFNTGTSSYAPDFERDPAGRIIGRAPVNLNWAKDQPPVLRALLKDLSGIYVQDDCPSGDLLLSSPQNGLSRSEGFVGLLPKVTLDAAAVDAIVAALQAHTGFPTWAAKFPDWDQTASFDSWDEFSRFVDLKLTALTQPQRDLLKANFNPNTASNKFNPGETVYKSLDKSDLTRYSTEFSLRSPRQALSASGRVLDASGRLLAERTIGVTAGFRQVRLTTQSEFCAGDLGALDVAGDETAFRKPGDAGFLDRSAGMDRTHGSRFPGCAPGLALQTYPEPQWPGAPCPKPAAYDGSLQLATIDTDISTPGLSFLAAYDDRYDATFAAGSPACRLDEGHGPPATSLLGRNPVGTRAKLNQVYPDGCYCETFREPGYEARLNVGDGYQGIASMWVRPHHESAPSGTSGTDFANMLHLTQLAVHPSGGYEEIGRHTQTLQLGMMLGRSWGVFAENRDDFYNGVGPADDFAECGSIFGKVFTAASRNVFYPHRWVLVTGQWNVLAASSPDFSAFCLNGTQHTDMPAGNRYYGLDVMPSHGQPDGGIPPVSATACLTRDTYREDGTLGMPYFYLGMRGITHGVNGPADATIDDLVFVSNTTDMAANAAFAGPRFSSGRYYKEDAGADPSRSEWTGALCNLGAGTLLLRADWTLLLPRPVGMVNPAMPDLWPIPNRGFFGTGFDLLAGESAEAALSLRDAGGSTLLPAPLSGRSGASVRLPLPGGALKLGIDLRSHLDDNQLAWDKLTAPVLESPVLDDITLTYTGPEGARLGSWREGE